MASKFVMKIERLDGTPVYLKPNGRSERELKSAITAHVARRILTEFDDILDKDGLLVAVTQHGVGMMRREQHVVNAIDASVDDHGIRQRLAKAISLAVDEAFHKIVTELKSDVEPVF